ncbi:MAG: FAD-dependent oxidoreductase [Bryobacterales bacterium]|nr:FAD-dependent oxidoreductase [Bryobacterales bacterium]
MVTCDVAVFGSGVFGAWTALWLRRAGASVVLLDPYGPGNSRSSSGGESRIIRMGYGPDEIYTQWSIRSLVHWKELAGQTGQRLFEQTGVLWMALEDDVYAGHTKRLLEKHGVEFETLPASELAARYPRITCAPHSWGLFEPRSGALMARRAVQAVAAEGARSGVHQIAEVIAAPAGAGVLREAVTASGTKIAAGAFVFACGPWLPKLFPLFLGRRICPTRQEVMFFGPRADDRRFTPGQFPVCLDLTDPRKPYCFPELDGRGYKIAMDAHGPLFDPDSGDRTLTPQGIADVRVYLAARYPDLRDAPLLESRVCQYENTSSGNFLIDRHPDFNNVWLVGGGSGHGFKHGPALGEHVAALISGHAEVEERFSLATKAEIRAREVF